ncbi:MAG: type II toxin-antitoxin system PemK/MazF family toxin [Planctomycetota bacterium]
MPPPAFSQWDVWLVEWKHEDGTSKPRPALIASTPAYASAQGLVWAMKITGRPGDDPSILPLSASLAEWPELGLKKPCFLYVERIQVIPADSLLRRYGAVPETLAKRVSEIVSKVTGLKIP